MLEAYQGAVLWGGNTTTRSIEVSTSATGEGAAVLDARGLLTVLSAWCQVRLRLLEVIYRGGNPVLFSGTIHLRFTGSFGLGA